jgi:hypothetical protein
MPSISDSVWPVPGPWATRRELRLGEIGEKRVLVEDRLPRPATGTVELHDDATLVVELDLVHAILEGAEGRQRPVERRPPTSTASRTRSGVRDRKRRGRHGGQSRSMTTAVP